MSLIVFALCYIFRNLRVILQRISGLRSITIITVIIIIKLLLYASENICTFTRTRTGWPRKRLLIVGNLNASSGSIQIVDETQPAFNPTDIRTFLHGSKAVGMCSWTHTSISAEINMWSCTATFVSALMAWRIIKHRDNCTFYLISVVMKRWNFTNRQLDELNIWQLSWHTISVGRRSEKLE
jgi:hypothetical protein